MKPITSLFGLLCFCSALYFGVSGGPLPTYSDSVSVSQKSKVRAKKGKKRSIKKVKPKRVKTQVALVYREDSV